MKDPNLSGSIALFWRLFAFTIKQHIAGWIHLKQPVLTVTITKCSYKNICLLSIFRSPLCVGMLPLYLRGRYTQIWQAHIWVGTCYHILEGDYIFTIYNLLMVSFLSNQFWLLQISTQNQSGFRFIKVSSLVTVVQKTGMLLSGLYKEQTDIITEKSPLYFCLIFFLTIESIYKLYIKLYI